MINLEKKQISLSNVRTVEDLKNYYASTISKIVEYDIKNKDSSSFLIKHYRDKISMLNNYDKNYCVILAYKDMKGL